MKRVYFVLSFVLGVLFLLQGFVFLFKDVFSAIPLLIISMFLLPPIRVFVHSKVNITIPFKYRIISVLVLLSIFGAFSKQADEKKQQDVAAKEAKIRAEKAVSEKQKLVSYFDTNSAQILAEARAALAASDYQKTVSLTAKYFSLGDPQLVAIYSEARAALLLNELKIVPESDFLKRKEIYQHLVTLYPKNVDYQSTLRSYERKISEMEEAQRVAEAQKKQAEARKTQIEKLFSGWDGSLRSLEHLIKNAMNDPDSYQHVETKYVDNGDHLIVIATFRGKNKFGAVVKNSVTAKVSLTGEVLEIIQ